MSDTTFKDAVLSLFDRYTEIAKRQRMYQHVIVQNDRELAKLRSQIVGLASLTDEIPEDSPLGKFLRSNAEMGLTDAVREVMKARDHGMTPLEIRDGLRQMGYDTSLNKNLQVSINTILKRLKSSGQVDQAVDRKTGKPLNLYRWSPFARVQDGEGVELYYEDGAAKKGAKKLTFRPSPRKKRVRKKV